MPNWCDCELSVCGDAEVLKKFLEDVKSDDSPLDADKVIPYPLEFKKLDDVAKVWDKKWNDVIGTLKSDGVNVDADERESAWKKFIAENGDRPRDGFNQGGYDWCVKNWGTKWGFCRAELVDTDEESGWIEFGFQTAWSPPIPLVKKMGEVFPELTFQLRYYEGGNAFQGSLTMKGGKEAEDWEGEYIGTRGG